MKNSILAVLCTVVSIVVLVFLIIGAVDLQKNLEVENEAFSGFNQKISDLEARIESAEKDLLRLEARVEGVEKKATLTIAFCNMSEEIYTKAFPMMQEYGLVGTLVMTGDRLPGGDSLLNDSQIYEMVNAGWKIIPGWTEGDGNNGILSTAKWISDYGYDFEGTVFIDSAALTPEYEALLMTEGYHTVISHVGFGTSADVTAEEAGELWNISAMGYRSIGPKGILNSALDIYGNFVFTVDFESDDSMFDHVILSSMLDYIKTCTNDGRLSVLNPADAREYRVNMDLRINSIIQEISSEKAEKEQIVSEGKAAVTSLYKEYFS